MIFVRGNTMVRINFEFKQLGIFWKRRKSPLGYLYHTNIWICLLPMLPLHISIISCLLRKPGQY